MERLSHTGGVQHTWEHEHPLKRVHGLVSCRMSFYLTFRLVSGVWAHATRLQRCNSVCGVSWSLTVISVDPVHSDSRLHPLIRSQRHECIPLVRERVAVNDFHANRDTRQLRHVMCVPKKDVFPPRLRPSPTPTCCRARCKTDTRGSCHDAF